MTQEEKHDKQLQNAWSFLDEWWGPFIPARRKNSAQITISSAIIADIPDFFEKNYKAFCVTTEEDEEKLRNLIELGIPRRERMILLRPVSK